MLSNDSAHVVLVLGHGYETAHDTLIAKASPRGHYDAFRPNRVAVCGLNVDLGLAKTKNSTWTGSGHGTRTESHRRRCRLGDLTQS